VRLIVGLGNPGRQYANTRHNLGFRVVEEFVQRHGAAGWRKKFNARVLHVDGWDTLAALPQTFMNASGESVQALSAFYKLQPGDLLIVCDDIALPFARLRMRRGGSSGGHNGLGSIIEALGTQDIARLRIGVGRATVDAVDAVLGEFTPLERGGLPDVIDR